MKIEGNNPGADALAARQLERARAEAKEAAAEAARKSGDRVELSQEAALAGSAIKAATDSPDVRPDVVERMKKALAAGELGSDSQKLAESLIDRMLDESHGKHG
jgi:flagellar biosynthesis anti-sigma factor FlgM